MRAGLNQRIRQNWLSIRPNTRMIATDGKITIDGISKDLIKPQNPLFVPQKFRKYSPTNQMNKCQYLAI